MKPSKYFAMIDTGTQAKFRDVRMDAAILRLLEAVEQCPNKVFRDLPQSGFSDTAPSTYTGTILHAALALKEASRE